MLKNRLLPCNERIKIQEDSNKGKPVYFLLSAWIISLPFMLNRYFISGALLQRVQISDIFFLFLFLVFIFKMFKGYFNLEFTSLKLPLALVVLSFFVSSLHSQKPIISFIESFIIIYLIVMYLIVINTVTSNKIMLSCLKLWVFAAVVVALLGIGGMILANLGFNNTLVRFYPGFLDKKFRLISTMSLPNMTYSYFHISFFLCLGLLVNQKHRLGKILYSLAIFFVILAILFTFSRGWSALLLGMAVFIGFSPLTKKLPYKFISLFLFVVSLIIFIFVQSFVTFATDPNFAFKYGHDERYKVEHGFSAKNELLKSDAIFEQGKPYERLDLSVVFLPGVHWYLKKAAVNLWLRHPLLGVGPGMFNEEFAKLKESGVIYIPSGAPAFDPHSTYFGMLAEQGLFGLFCLFILFFCFLKELIRAFKKVKDPYLKNIILCCISVFIGFLDFGINVDILSFRWVWFFIGLSMVIIRISESDY